MRYLPAGVVAFACLVVLALASCTTVEQPDGSTKSVLGFSSPEAQAQAKQSIESGAALLPFPFNVIVAGLGTIGVSVVGVYAAKKQAEVAKLKGANEGWDAAHAESPVLGGKPQVPPAA